MGVPLYGLWEMLNYKNGKQISGCHGLGVEREADFKGVT